MSALELVLGVGLGVGLILIGLGSWFFIRSRNNQIVYTETPQDKWEPTPPMPQEYYNPKELTGERAFEADQGNRNFVNVTSELA